ncbi:hypothetical protein MYMA111404_04255 [Mycoplasma marinum]
MNLDHPEKGKNFILKIGNKFYQFKKSFTQDEVQKWIDKIWPQFEKVNKKLADEL